MKIEIAQHGRMSESGSSLLRLIQNQTMPLLDLLVREAVQNSLDAVSLGMSFVNVDIAVREFLPKDLNKHLEGITEKLNYRFQREKQKCKSIVIRDSNTVGLTGPVRYEDVKNNNFGNCLKLIYEICKPQTNEGAGGSWGLGKTIYFRIGIGLVLYYSRFEENGKYRSRLAACFVEDETKSDSIIPSTAGVKRGIAWWGESVRKERTTIPIENEHEISKILLACNVSPYQKTETGTTVIIPYIDEHALLQEVYAKNEDAESKPHWVSDISEYLKIAFQRWYAPRILNSKYDGAYLNPSVSSAPNDAKIKISNMKPLFKTMRELYILGTTDSLPDDSLIVDSGAKYHLEDIKIREVFVHGTSTAGKFAFIKLNQEQLKMLSPDNEKSPYQQISNSVVPMENGNTPIVMFTRKPGMIVGYDYNSSWTHGMPHSSETEYIIGIFIANSKNKIKEIYSKSGDNLTLEEYLRQGEKADHASWTDRNIDGTNPRVVSKVQNGIIKAICKNYKEKTLDTVERTNIGLSRALANLLLPSVGFGKGASSGQSGGGNSGGGTGKKRSVISLKSTPVFRDNNVDLEFELNMARNASVVRMLVVTDYKKIGADEWESIHGVGQKFPLEFTEIKITEIKGKAKNARWEKKALSFSENGTRDNISLKFKKTVDFNTASEVIFECNEPIIIRGIIVFQSLEKGIKGTIEVGENKNERSV